MRIKKNITKNVTRYYLIDDIYLNKVKKTVTIEDIGTYDEILNRTNQDPEVWTKQYAINKTIEAKKEKEKMKNEVIVKLSTDKIISKNKSQSFIAGYLPLQKIYYDLGINKICSDISKQYKFSYDLNDILSKLVYNRILYPSSKIETLNLSNDFLEKPTFSKNDLYRALVVLAKHSDEFEKRIYENSLKVINRNTDVLYYDCTNFFFETDNENELLAYGVSKENRPNPIVQMGLFMDGSGIPIAFCLNRGNTNEQKTLKPIESRIIKDFKLSEFIVCTDAGLNSTENKKFNDTLYNRKYISTFSVKKAKAYIKEWCLDEKGWHLINDTKTKYDLSKINLNEYMDTIFYKERYIIENGIEEKIIVSFSPRIAIYQKQVRDEQIERARNSINKGYKDTKKRQTDFKRFITRVSYTKDTGEIAKDKYFIDENKIYEESKYDGIYVVSTNYEASIDKILQIAKNRWEIEESFRIMKSDFHTRPIYVSTKEAIQAHFLTCFISLLIYRILEKKIGNQYTRFNILKTLKGMYLTNFDIGLVPSFNRTDLTDVIHHISGFRLDYKLIDNKNLKIILKKSKNKK